MVDCFDRLRHHVVVGRHDDDGQVGYFRASGTHCGERLVARGVEEGYVASVGKLHVVCAYVLGDASGFACDHVGLADVVQKRCLAVVHVSHHRHDRRTRQEVFFRILHGGDCLRHVGAHVFGGESELFGHDVDGLSVKPLVDGHHHAEVHASGDDVVDRHVHKLREVVGRHEFRDFYDFALCGFSFGILHFAVVHLFALLFAPFDALLGGLVGETGQGLFHLTLHVFAVDLLLHRTFRAAFAFCRRSSAVVSVAALVAVSGAVVSAAVLFGFRVLCDLCAGLLDVHLLFADAFALFAVGACAALGLRRPSGVAAVYPLFAPLLFALLFGAGVLVERGQVYFINDLELYACSGSLQAEHSSVVFRSFGSLLLFCGLRLFGSLLLIGLLFRLFLFRRQRL